MSIRLCATAGLLWVLAVRLDLGRAAQMMADAAPPLVVAALVALLTANLIVALRWHVILSAEAPSPGAGVLVRLVLVGYSSIRFCPPVSGATPFAPGVATSSASIWGQRSEVFFSTASAGIWS